MPSSSHPSFQTTQRATTWPVLNRFLGPFLRCVALPLGGLGTGTVSLGGRGNLRDWEVMNRPAKGFAPQPAFFALRVEAGGAPAITRLLEGPLDEADYAGAHGSAAPNHGLPRFRGCVFEAAYPLAQVHLTDPDVPVRVRLQAFNPFVPGDADDSAWPVAALRVHLENQSDLPVKVSVCGALQNFVGYDGFCGAPGANVNEPREEAGLHGLLLRSRGVPQDAEQWGSLALATTAQDVSLRTDWRHAGWGAGLIDFWDDFAEDGRLEERPSSGADAPVASLAAGLNLPPHGAGDLTFLLAWHFPNRMSWATTSPQQPLGEPVRVGNFYAARFADAWDVAKRFAPELPGLEARTVAFVRAFVDSDLPHEVKEAALSNLSTLRSQTVFRTEDGYLFGWEGCNDVEGSCYGSCNHVWNYDAATAMLFPDLARGMREVEFLHALSAEGRMSFRVELPLARGADFGVAAADGQLGCLVKLYREWRQGGDAAWLRSLWPAARRALEFCWVPGGWDADQDGVMEGCQHNTMDVEYYGPNPQMQGWYLAALRACEEMARAVGEADFAALCRQLYERGRAHTDRELFNGEYYQQIVRTFPEVAPGLRAEWNEGESAPDGPPFQLGAGCLVDQLVGQLLARVSGLGDVLDPAHVQTALKSVARYNTKSGFWDHFNPMRSYALGDETALLMCSYPRGPFPTLARP